MTTMEAEKKKILFVITKANWGGAQRYVFDMATAARDAGHAVAVAYGTEGVLTTRLKEQNIETVQVPGLTRDVGLSQEFHALSGLVQFFKDRKPDIVHLNSSKAGALGALAARRAGVPRIIFTAHGWAFNEARPWWQKMLLRLASGAIVVLAHETICVSEAARHDIAWVPFSKKKLRVIHNGIEIPEFTERAAARRALMPGHEDAIWIGVVSELHPTKRIPDVIEAFTQMHQKHPNSILVIVSEGQERASLEKLIRATHTEASVFLLGFVPQVSSLLKAFDIFVQASRTEALAYTVLEAGAAGLPVIATHVGGIPEIIEPEVSGVLVPPCAPRVLQGALERLLETKDYARGLGQALEKKIRARFSKEKMVRETIARY